MSEVAYTQVPDEGTVYPGYVNFTALDDGRVKITVRASQLKGPGADDVAREGELAQLVISGRDFVQLIADANQLKLPEAVMDDPAQPKMDLPFAGDPWPGGKAEGAVEKVLPIEPAVHESDAIVVDHAALADGMTLDEAIDAADQKHEAQMLDQDPDWRRAGT